jgi:protein-S-isoprenylcysteine O-methyltransferase Ste14
MSRTTQNLRLVSETLLHTILLPGTIAVFVPYSMLSGQGATLASGILVIPGAILISLGVALLSWCTWDFIAHGRGTPNPLDPPKFLVAQGPYRRVRNPMYVGVGLILFGESLMFDSLPVLVYTATVLFGFHLFVLLYEEPTLRSQFGESYEQFCRDVPRWLPRATDPSSTKTSTKTVEGL